MTYNVFGGKLNLTQLQPPPVILTATYKLHQKILKMYPQSHIPKKKQLSRSRLSMSWSITDRQMRLSIIPRHVQFTQVKN